jgi:hypothetical protein
VRPGATVLLVVCGPLTVLCGTGAGSVPVAAAGEPVDPVRVVRVQDPRIAESSGLVVSPTHPGLVWTTDDSGTEPVLYGVSTRTGRTRAVLRLADGGAEIEVRDPEALAAGPQPPGGGEGSGGAGLLWVADIGDNDAVRPGVLLHLVREPGSVRSGTVPVVSLRLRYPSGPADAEALVWTPDGRLLIITKALLAGQVWQVPPAAVARLLAGRPVRQAVTAVAAGAVPQTLVTDATALPDGRIVVRDYAGAVVYRPAGTGFTDVGSLDLPDQPQGETIAAEPDGRTVLVGSEGVRQPLWRVAVPGAAPTSATSRAGRPAAPAPAAPGSTTPRRQVGQAGLAVGAVLAALVVGAGLRAARRRGRRTR